MTKSPAPIAFSPVYGRWDRKDEPSVTRTLLTAATIEAVTDYSNSKNKAEGLRRYGYQITVTMYVNPNGETAFRPEYQTTLNGAPYQSGKYGDFYATLDDALAAGQATAAGALKRYAKLAQKLGSGIHHTPAAGVTPLGLATTCKIAAAADDLKK